MVELGQRLAGVLDVGIGHRRVLAHDVHAPDRSFMDGVHDLDHGQPPLRIKLHAPEILVAGARFGVLDGLVVGEEHRDEPGIGGALHVVLAAQRMEPGPWPADLACRQRHGDQAARVVGAVDVL